MLLYELLTGATPFDTRELLKAGLDEVRIAIRNREPVRPSTKLTTMGAEDLTAVSVHRRTEPEKLIREVSGDLDWIVMKALEKDRVRRYATANGLAVDIRRFLSSLGCRGRTERLTLILENPKDIQNVRSLTTKDVTYVSLNYANPDLKKVMPWCGTSYGPESIVKTFVDVGRFWRIESFKKEAMFTDGENVAVFGKFIYQSAVLSKKVTSPFSIFAKVRNGLCTYMQFMEDTFATGASFRTGGKWIFRSDPSGVEVVI